MPIKLQNLADATTETFPWGTLRWLMNDQLEAGAAQTFGFCRIEPHQSNPLHLHPNCEEILHVISGTCEHILGDESVPMEAGDTIRIPANVAHCARNRSDEPLEAFIIFSSGDRQTTFLESSEPPQ